MKFIALVCLMVFSPIFASDAELLIIEQYHKRIHKVQQETDKLEQDIFSTLQAKSDVLASVCEQIEAVYKELNLPQLLLAEHNFLKELKHPEELL